MDPDDALIDLLNGIGSYQGFKNTNQKPFLDEAGLPTDSFLQALKHDFSSFASAGANQIHPRDTRRVYRSDVKNHVADMASDGSDILDGSDSEVENSDSGDSSDSDDVSDDDDESYSTERKISEQRGGGLPQNQSYRTYEMEDRHDEQQRSSRVNMRSAQISSTISKTINPVEREKKNRKEMSSKTKKSNGDKEKQSVKQRRASQSTENSRSNDRSQAQSNRSFSAHQKVPPSDSHGTAVYNRVSAPLHLSAAAVSVPEEEAEAEADLLKAEAEVKIKSLTLRITGQLQTIRVLETQLGEVQHSLKLKSLQASQAESRIKMLEPREKEKVIMLAKSKSKEHARLQLARAGADDSAERLKVQINVLHGQVADEQARRQRAEERGRALKSYVQTAKVQVREEESLNKELRAAVEALTAKAARYKRECREQAIEATVQRNLAAEKVLEASRQADRADRAEGALRHASINIEKLRDDVRAHKVEIASGLCKQKAAQQEVDLLRERDSARKAEARLRGLSSSEVHSERDKERQRDSPSSSSSLRTAPVPLQLIPGPRSRTLVGSSSSAYPSSDVDDDRSVDSNIVAVGTGKGSADAAVGQRGDGVTPRFRPPSSSLTPPRKPHYTIPLTPAAALSKSDVVGLMGRAQPSTRSSYSYGGEGIADGVKNTTFPMPSISLQVTSSGGLPLPQPLCSLDYGHQGVSSQSKKQDKGGDRVSSLRSPPAASTAQYFSDSELQHYERHSSSRSLTDLIGQRQGKDESKGSYPPRPPVSSSSADFSADPVSAHIPEPSGKTRTSVQAPYHRISYIKDLDQDRSEPRGASPVPERDMERERAAERNIETSRRQDRSVSGEVEDVRNSSGRGNVQARAEQPTTGDKDRERQMASHSASDTIAVARSFLSARRAPLPVNVHLSASAPASSFAAGAVPPPSSTLSLDGMGLGVPAALRTAPSGVGVGARFDRLQNMYERVTGSAVPKTWRDSDSESSDSD